MTNITTIDGERFFQPHPNYAFEANRLRVINGLNASDTKSVHYLPGTGDAFHRLTLGEKTLQLDTVIREHGKFRFFNNIFTKKGTPTELIDLLAATIKKLKV